MRTAALAAVVAGVLVTGAAPATGSGPHHGPDPASAVTLITGDRVTVGDDGRVASLVRGEGREKIGFSVRRERGHTYVIPQDALRLVTDGVLDRRLFDVARLTADGYGDALPLIVGYRKGGAPAAARARDPFAGVAVRERRALPAVDGEAFAVPKTGVRDLWAAVTGRTPTRTATASARPVAHIWLDARVRASLAESVPQIGAPAMWKSGYTGKGVTVAVLDSGVDETHPDLKGVEIAQKNFSGAPDAKDHAEGAATDWLSTEVPGGSAVYRLTVEAGRAAVDTATSTKVTGVWTFTSARPASGGTVRLPLSTVRLAPQLSLRGTAPAGGTLTVPLRLAGPAAGAGQVAALTVAVSFDAGRTWKPLTVATDAKGSRSVTVKHPATAKAASFRVDLKDKAGNTVRETITSAYLLAP